MSIAAQPQLLKPSRWAVSPGLVAANWRDLWRGLHYGFLLWEGGGDPQPTVGQHLGPGTRTSVVWVPTEHGLALRWNADTDRIVLPDLKMDTWSAFTVTLLMKWAASPDVADSVFAFAFQNNGRTERVLWHFNTSGATQWRARVDAGGTNILINDSDVSSYQGIWRLMHFTYDGARVTVYKDGIILSSAALTGSLDIGAGAQYALGNATGTNFGFEGEIALFLVHNRGLTAGEVFQHSLDPFGPFRMADEAGVVYATGAAAQTVTPGATTITSGLPSVTAVPGAVVLAPGPLSVASGLPGATVIPGAVSVSPSAVTLAGGLPGITAVPGEATALPSPVLITATIPTPAIVPGSVVVTPSVVALVLAAVTPTVFIGVEVVGTITLSGELALVVSLDGESLVAIPLSALRVLSVDLQGEVP